MSLLAAFTGTAIAAALLSYLALHVGWVDQRAGQEHRKLRKQPVPLVGGAAILIGVTLSIYRSAETGVSPWSHVGEVASTIAWPALLVAFLVGLADDLAPRGMAAAPKFAGQLLVAALVVAAPGTAFEAASAQECVALGLLALVAMNAVNLLDHADGLVGGLCAMAMLAAGGPVAGVFGASAAGYLPFNLLLRQPNEEPESTEGEAMASDQSADQFGIERGSQRKAPYAMLGDSGSHMVGVLIATTPGAWWFLAIPLLDMMRVVLGRLRRGTPFWRGDRTHVGHLLGDIGFSPLVVAALVGLTMAPVLVTLSLMEGQASLISGLLAGSALYFGILVLAEGALGDGGLERAAGGGPGAPAPMREQPLSDVSIPASRPQDARLDAAAGQRSRLRGDDRGDDRSDDRGQGDSSVPIGGPFGGPFASTSPGQPSEPPVGPSEGTKASPHHP